MPRCTKAYLARQPRRITRGITNQALARAHRNPAELVEAFALFDAERNSHVYRASSASVSLAGSESGGPSVVTFNLPRPLTPGFGRSQVENDDDIQASSSDADRNPTPSPRTSSPSSSSLQNSGIFRADVHPPTAHQSQSADTITHVNSSNEEIGSSVLEPEQDEKVNPKKVWGKVPQEIRRKDDGDRMVLRRHLEEIQNRRAKSLSPKKNLQNDKRRYDHHPRSGRSWSPDKGRRARYERTSDFGVARNSTNSSSFDSLTFGSNFLGNGATSSFSPFAALSATSDSMTPSAQNAPIQIEPTAESQVSAPITASTSFGSSIFGSALLGSSATSSSSPFAALSAMDDSMTPRSQNAIIQMDPTAETENSSLLSAPSTEANGSSIFGSALLGSSATSSFSPFAALSATGDSTTPLVQTASVFDQQPEATTDANEANEDDEDSDKENKPENGDAGAGAVFGSVNIPAVPEQEVITGEENEATLHQGEGKLFVIEEGKWRERGAGTLKLKITMNEAGGRPRLVMRTGAVMILNTPLFLGMATKIVQEKFVVFDGIEGEGRPKSFGFWTPSPTAAADLCKAIDRALNEPMAETASSSCMSLLSAPITASTEANGSSIFGSALLGSSATSSFSPFAALSATGDSTTPGAQTASVFDQPEPTTNANEANEGDENSNEVDDPENGDDGAGAVFGTVNIPLVPEQEVITGEENEATLHQVKGKLFVMENGVWRERGPGTLKLKITMNEAERRPRLVMRTGAVLRLILNTPLFLEMATKIVQEKFVVFGGIDAEGRPTSFGIRTPSPTHAADLCEAIDRALNEYL